MAGFDKFTTTNKGLALLGKAQTGVELRFTQMKVGDGTLSGQAIPTMNDLISPKMVIDLNKLKFLGEGKAVVGGLLSNSELATGFYFREWGVFALDPDEGEIMFCYANAGAAADYIPPGGSSAYEQQLNAVTIIGAAQNVSAEIVSGIYAAAEDLEDHVKDKNNPHGVTPEQIGAETPAGAQAKADAAEVSAKAYTDTVAAALQSNLNNHIGQGGTAHATATTTQAGFMSASDKAKLDGIQPGAQVNTVTSVAGKTGAVTLTKSDVGLGNVPNYPAASQAQAEAGTDNATLMTPLRTAQAIAAKTGGIQFRINNGVLEYNDGGTWRPVGGIKSVQRGTASISSSGESYTDVVISAVDINKSFAHLNVIGNLLTSSRWQITAKLINSTTLRLTSYGSSGSIGTHSNLEWEVVEFY